LCLAFFSISIFSKEVYASDNTSKSRIGNMFFDSLEEAILASSSTDIIQLTNDISLEETLEINKTVNIDLNGRTIKAVEKVFFIQGGSLKLTGTGKIIETNPNYGAIMLKGSNDPTKENFSTVTVGSDVTLEGWSGIFISQNGKTGYGITVNMYGKINSVNDTSGGTGAGIYVNGNIQNIENSPVINLSDTTEIISTGNGIYAAGYATYNINGAYISGEESGLGIKSGIFNIINAKIIGTGEDKTPTSGNNNGINPSGTAIQIESNAGYPGNIELYIKNGNIESKHSNTIYEYTVNNTTTKVKNISLTGGNYKSPSTKTNFELSSSFKTTHPHFISGGTYSTDPTNYLNNGYSVSKNEDSLYEVTTSTMQVFLNKDSTNTPNTKIIIVTITLVTTGIIIFLNRKKLFK